MKSNFRLPGPTPLPPSVLEAMQRPMIQHRGPEFAAFCRALLERLKRLHRTTGDVLLWPGSGSAGWEIAVLNLLSPGDEVVAAVTGDFGDRFAGVAGTMGMVVHRIDCTWGEAIAPELLEQTLREHPATKAVLLTHNETSTGVTNPMADLAAVARAHGALVLVDAVSSAAGLPLDVDGWGLDFVLSGSQKAWMCPPGIVIVTAGPRVWEAQARSTSRRFFWDMAKARELAAEGWTPTTPPLTLLYALDAAAQMLEEEGIDEVWERHRRLGELTRAGLGQLGLTLLADEAFASNTVTAFFPPEGISNKEIIRRMEADFGITVAGGQAHLASQIVRIGHMGWVDEEDIESCLSALSEVLETANRI